MNFFRIFLFLLSAGILWSCNPSPEKALEYNDRLIALQTSVLKPMQEFDQALPRLDKAEMESKLDALDRELTLAVGEAKKIEPFDGDAEFRDKVIELLTFYQQISRNEYRKIISIITSPDFTEEDKQEFDNILNRIQEKEEKIDSELRMIQENFARKHDFKLQPANS